MSWIRHLLGRNKIGHAPILAATARRDFTRALHSSEKTRLANLAARFLSTKTIEGAAGLVIDDEMRCDIAIQACLPILNLDSSSYDDWHAVILYPGDFVVHRETIDEDGVVHEWRETLAGESWERGPVIISWDANIGMGPEANVVIHEFAHKLDMLNGDANGCPPLHSDMSVESWAHDFALAFEDFGRQADSGRYPEIDDYAAESPAEFFAVLSELFFVQPVTVVKHFPSLYSQLHRFYRQDPLHRLSAK